MGKKKASLFSHVMAVLLLPFNVTVIIPFLLLMFLPSQVLWGSDGAVAILLGFTGAGAVLAGLTLVVLTVRQFAERGKGTLAPWDAPRKLVVSGPYRYTRNPMISGVIFILLGESLLAGSFWLAGWFVLFSTVNYTYFVIGEEPELEKKFGEEYREYKRRVPRLIPRRPGSRT
ncbi:methyltransferase family protein [Alteribacter natronophilus]|uniref:methyltransferase family protein n=1 Tax=Alteribacter natronophilus TaxID=2583810 RepID=UPI00110F3715|nr:isoprenylcysteine carboxylmethyltransferase family protein [Alteribacter natronophilus]TMW70107.1 isoprenylcysteine carboxylmethyltransferase family protein [Alteribacter natronophilus]